MPVTLFLGAGVLITALFTLFRLARSVHFRRGGLLLSFGRDAPTRSTDHLPLIEAWTRRKSTLYPGRPDHREYVGSDWFWAGDVKKPTDFTPEYRLRAGDYRVLLKLEADTVIGYRVLHRKDAY